MNTLQLRPVISFFLAFLFLAQASFANAFDDEPRKLALVIGISDYPNIKKLQFADKDAKDFASYLIDKKGMNLPKENVKLYVNSKATRATILYEGLNWLAEELRPGDEAYIFFSGHGDVTNMDAQQDILKTGYLLTYESEKDKYETTALKMEDFLKEFHLIASKKKATVRVIMDVCHSGIGMKSGGILSMMEMVGQFDPDKQILITSCKYDQLSYEYESLQNGVFTYFLMQGLKGAADEDGDEIVTLDELTSYSSKNVKRYVKKRNNTLQSPEFKGKDSHWLGFIPEGYEGEADLDRIHSGGSSDKGVKKGVDRSTLKTDPKVAQLIKDIEHNGISSAEIEKAFNVYNNYPQNTPGQAATKRKMKRDLVALMVSSADKAITSYFQKEGAVMKRDYYKPVSEYYLKSAKLLGEDHYQYNTVLAKYFFTEALLLKTIYPNDPKILDKLQTSLTLQPSTSYTLNEIGNIYFARGDYKKALNYYEKASRISPTWGKNIIKANNKLEPNRPRSYANNSPKRINTSDGSRNAVAIKNQVFRIQLSAAGEVHREQFKKIEDLAPVVPEYNPEKNVINTWMGPFETDKEANAVLKKVKQRGFKDAFVVVAQKDDTFEKKLIEKEAELKKEMAATSPYQIRIAAVKKFNKADFANLDNIEALPITVKGKSMYRVVIPAKQKQEANLLLKKVKAAGYKDAYVYKNPTQSTNPGSELVPTNYAAVVKADFCIQIASVSKLIEGQFSNLEHLGQVYIDVVPEKDIIRVYLGDYTNKPKATTVLKQVKNLGYKDAFIRSKK